MKDRRHASRVEVHAGDGTPIAGDVRVADRFFARLRGLLGTSSLERGQGLWIEPCRSVHTFGMRYAIDVVYLDASGRILLLRPALRPGRIGWAPRGCAAVLELAEGEVGRHGLTCTTCLIKVAHPHGVALHGSTA